MSHSARTQLLTLKLATFVLTASLLVGSNRHMSAAQESGTPATFETTSPTTAAPPKAPIEPASPIAPAPVTPVTPAAPFAKPAGTPNAIVPEPADPFASPVSRAAPRAGVVHYPDGAPRATAVPDAERLRILEKQILELIGEMRAIRAGNRGETIAPPIAGAPGAASVRSSARSDSMPSSRAPRTAESRMAGVRQSNFTSKANTIDGKPHSGFRSDDPNVQSVAIVRSTYKLPAGRAAVLAKFLTEQLNDEIEIKVKGDALQVTASAEDQQAIEQVIRLFQRKERTPAKAPLVPETGA